MRGMSTSPRLVVSGARRAFGARTALDGVDLVLAPGEIYALLGRNGAGKTTLVRAISGRVRLDEGRIALDGRDPIASPAARRALGLVPQEIALYGDLTIRENLEILGALAGLGRRAARAAAEEALRWTGLEDRAASRVETLSGGMRRRINIAAGTLHVPSTLLLDEPTVGVDPQARERIHELLRDLKRRGMTILLTTHDLEQAAALADRIGILDEGRLKAEGTLAELIARTFGAERELRLTLAAPPDEAGRAALAALGLAPRDGADPRRWAGPIQGGLEALAQIEQALAAAGLRAVEAALREPDLYGVFFKVTGKELDE